jgi:hypothetical protein
LLLSLLITWKVAALFVEYLPGSVKEWCPGEYGETPWLIAPLFIEYLTALLLSLLITWEVAPLFVEYLPGSVEECCPGEYGEYPLSVDVMLGPRKLI